LLSPQVAQRMEARLTREGLSAQQRADAVPVAEDFGEQEGRGGDAAEVFSNLIGCQQVLGKLREWQATIKASQNQGRDPLDSFELNFLFVGPPGATPSAWGACWLLLVALPCDHSMRYFCGVNAEYGDTGWSQLAAENVPIPYRQALAFVHTAQRWLAGKVTTMSRHPQPAAQRASDHVGGWGQSLIPTLISAFICITATMAENCVVTKTRQHVCHFTLAQCITAMTTCPLLVVTPV
jgi:hypothetical protein